MVPVFQKNHNDCLRATVASLLELRYEDVPHFEPSYDGDGLAQMLEMQKWLRTRGLVYVEWKFENFAFVDGAMGKELFWLCTCESTLGRELSHAFVGRARSKNEKEGEFLIEHDPRRHGVTDLEKYKLTRVGLLVPIRVWEFKPQE